MSDLFAFKNKETEEELLKVISTYEGVERGEVQKYLAYLHTKRKAQLLIETKRELRRLWAKNPNLPLSDFIGLVNLAMLDMETEILNKSTENAMIVTDLLNSHKLNNLKET